MRNRGEGDAGYGLPAAVWSWPEAEKSFPDFRAHGF
jgi:hypothetical protein